MRCTRCDRPTVPQAIGTTLEGLLVFGWCVSCLREAGCRTVVVARPRRRRRFRPRVLVRAWAGRMSASLPHPKASQAPPEPERGEPRPPDSLQAEERRRTQATIALVLSFWGLAVFCVGLSLYARHIPRRAAPIGNGTPGMLLGGGGATMIVGLTLWWLSIGRQWVRLHMGRRAGTFVLLTVILAVVGTVAARSVASRWLPVVALTVAALGMALAARWLEHQRERPMAPWNHKAPEDAGC